MLSISCIFRVREIIGKEVNRDSLSGIRRGTLMYHNPKDGKTTIKFIPDNNEDKHRVFVITNPPRPSVNTELNLEGDRFYVYGERPITDSNEVGSVIRIPIKMHVRGVAK